MVRNYFLIPNPTHKLYFHQQTIWKQSHTFLVVLSVYQFVMFNESNISLLTLLQKHVNPYRHIFFKLLLRVLMITEARLYSWCCSTRFWCFCCLTWVASRKVSPHFCCHCKVKQLLFTKLANFGKLYLMLVFRHLRYRTQNTSDTVSQMLWCPDCLISAVLLASVLPHFYL